MPPTGDILDVINRWPEEQRKQAYATIAEIEEEVGHRLPLDLELPVLNKPSAGAVIPAVWITRGLSNQGVRVHGNGGTERLLVGLRNRAGHSCARHPNHCRPGPPLVRLRSSRSWVVEYYAYSSLPYRYTLTRTGFGGPGADARRHGAVRLPGRTGPAQVGAGALPHFLSPQLLKNLLPNCLPLDEGPRGSQLVPCHVPSARTGI